MDGGFQVCKEEREGGEGGGGFDATLVETKSLLRIVVDRSPP